MPMNYGYADAGLMRQPNRQLQGLQGTLAALQQHNAMVAARPARQRRPVGLPPMEPGYGLGGVGGQYANSALTGAIGTPGARAGVPSAQAMMDPRQRNFQGGGVQPMGLLGQDPAALAGRGAAALAGMQAAGIGQVDPATGTFLGAGATGLMGDARAQRVAGMIGRLPGGPGLAPDVAAGRQAFAASQREAALAPRRALVQERGIANADARRVRMGQLTFDERLQAGVPGLAVARELGGVQRDVAGVQAGAQRDVAGIAAGAQERVAQAGLDAQKFMAEGNWRAAAKAQRAQLRGQRELAKMQGETALGVAGLQTEAGVTQAESSAKLKERELGIQESQSKTAQSEQFRQAAQAAAASGDYEGYQRYTQMADSLLPRAGLQGGRLPPTAYPGNMRGPAQPPGLPGVASQVPQSWGQVPLQMRKQLAGGSAEEMVNNIRQTFPDMPQDQMDDMIQAAYPGTSVTAYNPDGYGLTDFIGTFTGLENLNRWRAKATGAPQPPAGFQLPSVPGLIQNWLGY